METSFYVLLLSIPAVFFGWVLVRAVRSGMRKVEFGDVLLQFGLRRSPQDPLVFEGDVRRIPVSVRHVFVEDEHRNRTEQGWRVTATHLRSRAAAHQRDPARRPDRRPGLYRSAPARKAARLS